MISYLDMAISAAIIFIIVFIWIVIILRQGVLNNLNTSSQILEDFKKQAMYETDEGDMKINRKLLAKLVYEAILKGEWSP